MIGAVITPDMSRYCRNGKDVFWMTLIGTFVGELGVNMIAVLMAHAVGTDDVVTIVLQTSGWLGAAIVIFATVKINDLNLYSASLGLSNLIDSVFSKKINRGWITFVIGVVGTVLSVLGILEKFQNFLVFLGVWIPPIAGIMVVDYFILKRGRKFLDESRLQGQLPKNAEPINPITLIAWALGFFAGYFIQFGIPSLNSLLVSAIMYWIGMKMINMSKQRNLETNENIQ